MTETEKTYLLSSLDRIDKILGDTEDRLIKSNMVVFDEKRTDGRDFERGVRKDSLEG
mgnify:CR=1 FL=1